MSMFYLDKENRIIPIPLGKPGEVLQMDANGVPVFGPLASQPPVEPPFKLTVNAGADLRTTSGSSVTLKAIADKATAFAWKVIKAPASDSFVPVATVTHTGTGADATIDASKYAPGTLVVLSGNFNSLQIKNAVGTSLLPIIFQNKGKVVIGNPKWAGSGNGFGLRISGSHFFEIECVQNGDVEIQGSTVTATNSPSGEQWRAHYRNIDLTEFTDNFIIDGVNSFNGGHGVVAKTDPIASNPATWGPNTLGYMQFWNMTLKGNWNEAMYLGHTATAWNVKTSQPVYGAVTDPANTKEPMLIEHIYVAQCKISDCGLDGVQTAAAKKVTVFSTEVTNWAMQKNMAHNGGILIGGRVESSFVNNNWVHDGFGEILQFYGSGKQDKVANTPEHEIWGNLFEKNELDMVSLRGSKQATVYIHDNVLLEAGKTGNLIRVNGYTNGGGRQAMIDNNILAGPLDNGAGGIIYPKNFIYAENGSADMVSETVNKKYNKVTDVPNTIAIPKTGPVTAPVVSTLVIKSPTAATTVVEGFVKGEYIFEVTAKYEDQTAIDTVTVTVD